MTGYLYGPSSYGSVKKNKNDYLSGVHLLYCRSVDCLLKKSTYITLFDRKNKWRALPVRPHTIHWASMCIVLFDKLSVAFTLSRCWSKHFTTVQNVRCTLFTIRWIPFTTTLLLYKRRVIFYKLGITKTNFSLWVCVCLLCVFTIGTPRLNLS